MTKSIAVKGAGTGQPGVSRAPSKASVLAGWRTEDWVATILGFAVIAVILALFVFKAADLRNTVSNFRWTTDAQIASNTPGWNAELDAIIADAGEKKQQNVATLLLLAAACCDRPSFSRSPREPSTRSARPPARSRGGSPGRLRRRRTALVWGRLQGPIARASRRSRSKPKPASSQRSVRARSPARSAMKSARMRPRPRKPRFSAPTI